MGLVVAAIAVSALAVEFYKKGIRGEKTSEGTKTKASRWEIYGVAFVASIAWGLALSVIQHPGQWIWVPVYSAIVYFFQWVVDMKILKQVVNGLLTRIGE